ncbi:EamA family transporter [Blastococcus sp. TF02A_35]|uniref:EamA family transporter n=1 Tax=Blastococcus sp. TF02A-35 TaxID=2559612 RepID=UPI0014314CD7|nr:EamA family transporter [Blastococcus sp. TF02A_35]
MSGGSGAPTARNVLLGVVYLLIVLIWGTTWYAMKVSVESIPPITSAGLRFACAFPFLLVAVWLVPSWRLLPPPGSRWLAAVLTVSYVAVPYALINYGEQRTSSGLAAIIFASVTVLLVVMSVALGTTRVTPVQWGAITVGLGLLAALVIAAGEGLGVSSPVGPLAIFVAAVLHALSYALIARFGREVDVISLEVLPIGLGGALLLALGAVVERPEIGAVTARSFTAVLYLALVASVIGFALYFHLLQRVTPVVGSFVFIFFPIVALGLSVALEGVRFTVPMALAVLGVLVAFSVAKTAGAGAPAETAEVSEGVLAGACAAAERAFPKEACGFGLVSGELRAVANMADESVGPEEVPWHRSGETGYVMAPADVRYLEDSLDGPAPVDLIYHSHPNGAAYFSAEDLRHAVFEGRPVFPGVRHLVVGVTSDGVQEAALFDLSDGTARELRRWGREALPARGTRGDRRAEHPPAPDSLVHSEVRG